MERKQITDEMILEPTLVQLRKRIPAGEIIAWFILGCWILSIPMMIFVGGLPLALWDCVCCAALYFGYCRPTANKRKQFRLDLEKIISIQDFLIIEDTCEKKESFEELIGESYYITFHSTPNRRIPVTAQQYQVILEGDPFITVVLRAECLPKYKLKRPLPPLWWSAKGWYRA